MSLIRKHRERILAAQTVVNGDAAGHGASGGQSLPSPLPARHPSRADTAAKTMKVRLTHDLRRLKEIQSIERKIIAKREMLPEYAAWIEGLLAAGDVAPGDEVLPTIMIWRVDTSDFAGAMPLVRHVLRHDVPLPARYERTAPALIVEEIAIAALKMQGAGEIFPLDVLEELEELTGDQDMHDEIRAKLHKAIGVEMMRLVGNAGDDKAAAIARANAQLSRAHALHERVGVTVMLRQLARAQAELEKPAAADPKPAQAAPKRAQAKKKPAGAAG
jgi:hypothetical protein